MNKEDKNHHEDHHMRHESHDREASVQDQDEGHSNHKDHGMEHLDHRMHGESFKRKFWLSLILALPIIILAPMMGLDLPFQFTFPGSEWLVLVLASLLFFYGGWPFLSGAKRELKQKKPAMMTLIAMGISVAYIYSLYVFIVNKLLHQHVMDSFWELATLIVIMLLGHWIEMNAIANASGALKKLAQLLPDEVIRISQDGEERVSLQDIKEGDHLIVRAGDKMPSDGVIEKGKTIVDESLITGESKGVIKQAGAKVIGGSVNGEGTIVIQVTRTKETGYLAQLMDMVQRAQAEKSKLELLSDKVAKWLFYIALSVGILAFAVWLIAADLAAALDRMVTVFIIACPHALGLAVPLVVARSTAIAVRNGLLLKNRSALENAHDIDMILLDKTGTLTQGSFSVRGLELFSEAYDKAEALKFLGALEANANHPIATGIMQYIKDEGIHPYQASTSKNLSGIGLFGMVEGKETKIINEKELACLSLGFDQERIAAYQTQGNTISYLLIDDDLVAMIALGDEIKTEAKGLIRTLKAQGIEPMILTGDNERAASLVASYLGVDRFEAALHPAAKEKIVSDLTKSGRRVAMVGDGINDAPSLARATIGIAIGAGTDVAIDSADVVLINSNPEDILHFFALAKATRQKMRQNLWWGAGYNIVAIPLAAGLLAPLGIILNPALGAVLMSLSTLIVVLNAMTLKISQ